MQIFINAGRLFLNCLKNSFISTTFTSMGIQNFSEKLKVKKLTKACHRMQYYHVLRLHFYSHNSKLCYVLAALINRENSSYGISGTGSSRRYNFNKPAIVLMSSSLDKSTSCPSKKASKHPLFSPYHIEECCKLAARFYKFHTAFFSKYIVHCIHVLHWNCNRQLSVAWEICFDFTDPWGLVLNISIPVKISEYVSTRLAAVTESCHVSTARISHHRCYKT